MITLENCKQGYLYLINARNFSFGVFDLRAKGFIGVRYKFGDQFLFTEDHWDTGEPHGTVKPIKELELCPIENIGTDNTDLFKWLLEKRIEYKDLETPEEEIELD